MKSTDNRAALSEEVRYKLLGLIEANPQLTQREAARELGVSLGKLNYCLKSLVNRGWVKATNFTNSRNKAAYMYLLTPRGIDEKARITARFVQAKLREYEALRLEIERLGADVAVAAEKSKP